MADWKTFVLAPLMACIAFSMAWCGDAQMVAPGNAGNRINPGWYGWMGDFHDVNGYYAHPSDREYYRRHNINWFMLGHQWVVPFLETDTKAELFQAALEKEILLIPVNDIQDVAQSPQLEARGFFRKVEHPELGEAITYPGSPVINSEMPYNIRRRAPLIGEHNAEVYGELGFTSEEMVLLKSGGII